MRVRVMAPTIALSAAALTSAAERFALALHDETSQNLEALQKAGDDARAYVTLLREKRLRVREGHHLKAPGIAAPIADVLRKAIPGDNDADPREVLAITRDNEASPLDGFVALNCRNRLVFDQPGSTAQR